MGTIIKLCIRANILCIIGIVVCAVAVYVFNLGAWRVGSVPIFFILVFFTFAALIISCLQNLFFKPALSGQAAKFAKRGAILASDEMADSQVAFLNEIIDAKNKHEKIRYIAGGILGIVVYFVVGVNTGSPIAECVALAVLLLGPTAFGMLMQGSLMKLRVLDPVLFDSAVEMYSVAHEASFNASSIS